MAVCGESSSSFSNVHTPSGWDPSVQEFSGVTAIRNMVGHLRHVLRRTACKPLGSQCERWWMKRDDSNEEISKNETQDIYFKRKC